MALPARGDFLAYVMDVFDEAEKVAPLESDLTAAAAEVDRLTILSNNQATVINDLTDQLAIVRQQLADCQAGNTPPPPPPPPPPPHTVTLLGAAVEGGKPEPLETQLGLKLGLFRSYFTGSSSVASMVTRAKADIIAGRVPFMSTKLPGTWAQVAAGTYDAWLLDRVKALDVLGGAWLVLHHEPSGDGVAADWVRMQTHARTLIDANSDNVILVGVLNGWSFLAPSSPDGESFRCSPTTGPHMMGFDSYNLWSPSNGKAWSPAATVFSPGLKIQAWGYAHPVVGEFGCRIDSRTPGKAGQWITDAYQFAADHNFGGIAYFSSGVNSPDGPWTLQGETLSAFKAALTASRTTSAREG